MRTSIDHDIWFAAGVRRPFAKVDGPLGKLDAISLSAPVVRHMIDQSRTAIVQTRSARSRRVPGPAIVPMCEMGH